MRLDDRKRTPPHGDPLIPRVPHFHRKARGGVVRGVVVNIVNAGEFAPGAFMPPPAAAAAMYALHDERQRLR